MEKHTIKTDRAVIIAKLTYRSMEQKFVVTARTADYTPLGELVLNIRDYPNAQAAAEYAQEFWGL